MPRWALALVSVVVTACAGPLGGPGQEPAAARAPDFRGADIREPAVFLRVTVAPGTGEGRERVGLIAAYEGALLEGLNARAVVPRDAQRVVSGMLDSRAAVERARIVGADHAIVIEVIVERGEPLFCRDGGRPFRAPATTWIQRLQVLRASDGASRLVLDGTGLSVTDLQPDCDTPDDSPRRTPGETVRDGVSRLLTRLLDS